MVFSSLLFLYRFLPFVILAYFIIPKRFRNLILFIASLIFYAWGEPVYILIMFFSTIVDYSHGMLVQRFKDRGDMKKARYVLASSMILNLSILGFFKYSDFLLENINHILNLNIPLFELILPIGISFYTFQTMSYTIDVYRGDAKVQKNIISFGLYVCLFPQLIAGPIVQYKTIDEQLRKRTESFDSFSEGAVRFICGMGKKILLANNIGLLWDYVYDKSLQDIPVIMAWLGITAFAFQIYFDFSGYSDMAIGLGKMFGFDFLENFNYPYISKSITDFWRRWHISLGTWFKEYVYIPLGGNRYGISKQIRNIIIVWLLTGIWHGASWNFLLWGGYFAVLLIMEKLFLLKLLKKLPSFISHIYTIFFVWISWVIFSFERSSEVIGYIKAMFGINRAGFINNETLFLISEYAMMLVILCVACTKFPKRLASKVKNVALKGVLQNVYIILVFILSTAYLVGSTYNPFLYFRF